MSKKNVLILVALVFVLTLGISISAQSLMAAWTEPSAGAPGGNVAAPINVGITAQTKEGGLTIQGSTNTQGGLVIRIGEPSAPENGSMWLQ